MSKIKTLLKIIILIATIVLVVSFLSKGSKASDASLNIDPLWWDGANKVADYAMNHVNEFLGLTPSSIIGQTTGGYGPNNSMSNYLKYPTLMCCFHAASAQSGYKDNTTYEVSGVVDIVYDTSSKKYISKNWTTDNPNTPITIGDQVSEGFENVDDYKDNINKRY